MRITVEPLFLQAKEAQPSLLAEYCGRSQYANQGERVVAEQHLMQAHSDIFLGWTRAHGPDGVDRDFYVRQLRDWKFSAPIEAMIPEGMTFYARLCGWTLAPAHARSGDRIALAAYLGGSARFDQAIAGFAETYADQNERDYAALQAAVKNGTAQATTEIYGADDLGPRTPTPGLDVLRHRLLEAARHLTGARVLAARLYGVGPFTALALCCWLGGAGRFSSSRKAVRFAGLDVTVCPGRRPERGAPGRKARPAAARGDASSPAAS